jgi:hypothetical protein
MKFVELEAELMERELNIPMPLPEEERSYWRQQEEESAYKPEQIQEMYQEPEEEEIETEQAIDNADLEEIVRKKKWENMGINSLERTSPTTQEKWALAKMFPFYQIKMMLDYQLSLT